MKGWLIVNSFVDSEKFNELYSLLLESAKKQNVSLELLKGSELINIVGCDFTDKPLPDFVIFWDKDINLAKALENMGLRLFNSSDAINYCDDKAKTYIQLSKAGIRIPKTITAPKTYEGLGYTDFTFLQIAIQKLGLPLVIKESFGSFGQQVYLANTEDEAKKIIKTIGHKDFVLQEFISTSCGKDVRLNVVGQQVAASMLRYNDNDFRSNISNGGNMKCYTPSEEQQLLAIASAKALNLDFAGVDIIWNKDNKPLLCEINSNAHFKNIFDCTGVDAADAIIKYILKKI